MESLETLEVTVVDVNAATVHSDATRTINPNILWVIGKLCNLRSLFSSAQTKLKCYLHNSRVPCFIHGPGEGTTSTVDCTLYNVLYNTKIT